MGKEINPNKNWVKQVLEGLKKNGGFCPCIVNSLGKEEYRCPCKNFLEEVPIGGYCHCELFKKVSDE